MRLLVTAVLLVALGAAPATAAPLAVRTTLSPAPARFGDVVAATVAVHADPSVDPGSIVVRPGLAPYAVLGDAARSSSGDTVTFRYELACLVEACVPPRTVRLAPARVAARLESGDSAEARAAWPRLRVVPRVPAAALDRTPLGWQQQLAPAAPSYRMRPGVLAAVLTAGAALLVGAAAWAVAAELRRRRRALELADPRRPLERALALLRESVGRPPVDRRKALSLVSREVPGHERLERAATELAWSRRAPEADRVDELAGALEQELAAR
ncbi:MAG: hypothetical protein ACXWYS_05855 [Gaiellaceae bacterium]